MPKPNEHAERRQRGRVGLTQLSKLSDRHKSEWMKRWEEHLAREPREGHIICQECGNEVRLKQDGTPQAHLTDKKNKIPCIKGNATLDANESQAHYEQRLCPTCGDEIRLRGVHICREV